MIYNTRDEAQTHDLQHSRRGTNPRSTTLQTSTLTITSSYDSTKLLIVTISHYSIKVATVSHDSTNILIASHDSKNILILSVSHDQQTYVFCSICLPIQTYKHIHQDRHNDLHSDKHSSSNKLKKIY